MKEVKKIENYGKNNIYWKQGVRNLWSSTQRYAARGRAEIIKLIRTTVILNGRSEFELDVEVMSTVVIMLRKQIIFVVYYVILLIF